MSIADAVSRITQIQAQIAALQTGSIPAASASTPASSSGATPVAIGSASPAVGGGASTSASSFANTLAQAQLAQVAQSPAAAQSAQAAQASAAATATSALSQPSFSNALLSAPAAFAPATGGVSLPPAAATQLTTSQQQFAQTLATDTGLDPGVVSAWLLAEENGSAAQSRQAQGNNDWLNIGYTDSGTYGATDSVWSDPVSAANATAGWLRGEQTIPGYGTASAGIQAILQTAGQTPQAQITSIQGSGWASGGYPSLASIYSSVAA